MTPCSAGVDRYVVALAVLFGGVWTVLAIRPRYREDWALENLLTVAVLAGLVLFRRRLRLSRASWTALFVFLTLHTIGAHYTYSEVPYGRAINSLFGWERNHYDRLVHFAYGLLVVLPIRQVLMQAAGVPGIWAYYVPFAVVSSSSADYELLEWGAATVFGGELGMAYLGTQGDIWDAQKDMALAAAGALLSMTLLAIGNAWRRDA